jgi:long-chain acyl-CoA synthetase
LERILEQGMPNRKRTSYFGCKKGDCVGVFSQNSKDWVIFDVATQMLGAVTIPIYATNNYAQTEYIIKQTEMQHILVGDTPS